MIVDASVAAKWFLRGESYEDEALSCRKDLEDGTLQIQAPYLIVYEVANTIWKRRDIATDLASRLVVFATAYLLHITIMPSKSHASETMRLARKVNTTFYDASYLALAKVAKQPLLSADEVLLRKAAEARVPCIHILDYGH